MVKIGSAVLESILSPATLVFTDDCFFCELGTPEQGMEFCLVHTLPMFHHAGIQLILL